MELQTLGRSQEKSVSHNGIIMDNKSVEDAGGGMIMEEYLRHAENIAKFLALLGPACYLGKRDIDGNLAKIRKINFAGTDTVRQLLDREHSRGNVHGTDALLWLNRSLEFGFGFMTRFAARRAAAAQNANGKDDEVAECFREAYQEALEPHHGFVVRKFFQGTITYSHPNKDLVIRNMMEHFGDTDDIGPQAMEKVNARLAIVLSHVLEVRKQLEELGLSKTRQSRQ